MRQQPIRIAALGLVMGLVAASAVAQVKTTGGLVRGTTAADGAIRVFSGIPYAAPPVGDLRWRPPQLMPSWTGERDATKAGPAQPPARHP